MSELVECDHCGYVNEHEAERLSEVGDEGSWVCPSCVLCNTTFHKESGFVTVLGYQRNLEVGYLG